MFKFLAHLYGLGRIDLSLGAGMYASWMLRVSFLPSVCSPRFSFFDVRAFSAVYFINRSFFVYLCSSCQVFSLHIINWASLVIFASVLRCDSQSFGPVYSFILFGLFARPSISSNLAIVLQVFCLFYLLFSFSLPLIAIAQFCSYFFFTLYLFNFCFAVQL